MCAYVCKEGEGVFQKSSPVKFFNTRRVLPFQRQETGSGHFFFGGGALINLFATYIFPFLAASKLVMLAQVVKN